MFKGLKCKYKPKEKKTLITTPCCNKEFYLENYKGNLTLDEYNLILEGLQKDLNEDDDEETVIMPCCKEEIKEVELIPALKLHSRNLESIRCPHCKEKLKLNMLKLSQKTLNMLTNQECCNLCQVKIDFKEAAIGSLVKCDCGRKYHKTCLKKCDIKQTKECDCGKPITKLRVRAKVAYPRRHCIICKSKKEIYQRLKCRHGFCLSCFDGYIDDRREIDVTGTKYYCSKCENESELSNYLI